MQWSWTFFNEVQHKVATHQQIGMVLNDLRDGEHQWCTSLDRCTSHKVQPARCSGLQHSQVATHQTQWSSIQHKWTKMNNPVPRYLDSADINENKPASSFNRQNSRMHASRYVNCLPYILPSWSCCDKILWKWTMHQNWTLCLGILFPMLNLLKCWLPCYP